MIGIGAGLENALVVGLKVGQCCVRVWKVLLLRREKLLQRGATKCGLKPLLRNRRSKVFLLWVILQQKDSSSQLLNWNVKPTQPTFLSPLNVCSVKQLISAQISSFRLSTLAVTDTIWPSPMNMARSISMKNTMNKTRTMKKTKTMTKSRSHLVPTTGSSSFRLPAPSAPGHEASN